MELCINTALYFIGFVAVFVPFFGFVLSPGLIINTAITTFFANSAAQLKDLKLLDGYLAKNKDTAAGKAISGMFDAM